MYTPRHGEHWSTHIELGRSLTLSTWKQDFVNKVFNAEDTMKKALDGKERAVFIITPCVARP